MKQFPGENYCTSFLPQMTQSRGKPAVSAFRIHQSQLPFLRQLDEASIPIVSHHMQWVGPKPHPPALVFLRPRLPLPAKREKPQTPQSTHASSCPLPTPRSPLGETCNFLARTIANKSLKRPHTHEVIWTLCQAWPLGVLSGKFRLTHIWTEDGRCK